MKKYILLLIMFLISFNTLAQKIYTIDGVFLGTKKDFMENCIDGSKDIQMTISEDDMINYCECVVNELMPKIHSSEMTNDVFSVLSSEKNFPVLLDCLEKNININNIQGDINSSSINAQKNLNISDKQAFDLQMKSCIYSAKQEMEAFNLDYISEGEMEEYCYCAVTKLNNGNVRWEDLSEMEDEHSIIYNEIIMSCIEQVFDGQYDEFENKYVYSDISTYGGYLYSSNVDLISNGYNSQKIKLTIEGEESYYLLDTGSDELIIDSKLEKKLIQKGKLKQSDYVGTTWYSLADNSTIPAKIVKLNNIKIGDYIVDNVYVSIIENGGYLCGMGLLKKFKKWELTNEELILYK